MITVVTKSGFTDTWQVYLDEWSANSQARIRILTYAQLAELDEVAPGPVIFADIERLTEADRALGAAVADLLELRHSETPVLNHPGRALRRYELLVRLHERGLNPFRAYRLTETLYPDSFPVFLRYENDHTGATTGLLSNQSELERAVVRLRIRGHDLRQLLMVEFVATDTGNGIYHKYGSFRVGNAILARHKFTSHDWVSKLASAHIGVPEAEDEFDYVVENPYTSVLLERFELACLEYGRIDYAIKEDSAIVWEINSNPFILGEGSHDPGPRLPVHEEFVRRFEAALLDLDRNHADGSMTSLGQISAGIRNAVIAQSRPRSFEIRQFARNHKAWFEPLVIMAGVAAIPFERYLIRRWKRENNI